MKDIFGFMQDWDNHDERLVLRFKEGRLSVDTSRVSDGEKPYETGVAHPDYNGGRWVIVEAYDTSEQARSGQFRWVKTMTSGPLPDKLVDCCNSSVSQVIMAIGGELEFPRIQTGPRTP